MTRFPLSGTPCGVAPRDSRQHSLKRTKKPVAEKLRKSCRAVGNGRAYQPERSRLFLRLASQTIQLAAKSRELERRPECEDAEGP